MDHRKTSGNNLWNGNGNSNISNSSTSNTTTTTTTTSTSSSSNKLSLSPSTFTSFSSSNISGSSSFYSCETRRQTSSTYQTESSTSQLREVPMPASSFIVQRVERLYGPGALAQGFYARKSLGTPPRPVTLAQKECVEGKDSVDAGLPVLKLLRPEFRAQLTLAKRKSSSPICSPDRALDTADGAVERIIPVVVLKSDEEKDTSCIIKERETVKTTPLLKDGHYYLKMVMEEAERLTTLAADLELEISSVPEYMEGRLRAAAGKARLLANQKLAQFKGLCQKNINQDPAETFPTTCEDLAGFWDMVSIQVDNVHEEFDKIDILRKAGWPEQDTLEKNGKKANNREVVKNGGNTTVPARAKSLPAPVKNNAASKARDEARKRMLAERRKAMRETQQQQNAEDIVIM